MKLLPEIRTTKKQEGTGSGSTDLRYTNPQPVPQTLGGVVAGSTFNSMPIQQVLDTLLYPYAKPVFTSFNILGISSIYEVGGGLPAGTYVFKWTIDQPSNVKPNSINVDGTAFQPNTGSYAKTLPSIREGTPTTRTFHISGQDVKNQPFSSTYTITWSYRRYWGVSNKESLTDVDILMMSSELSGNKNKLVAYDCTGGNYFYFAYPSAFGDLTSATTINNMQWNDWVIVKRVFLNQNGVSIPFNIYRSFNLLNGNVNVNWG